MRRRDFVKLFAGITVAWSSVARAQQSPSPARIGWMSLVTAGASDPFMDAFRKGMIELGYVEGQNFLMEPRYGAGKFELMVEQATELERAGVDVIIAGPFDALRAAKRSTNRVPIIMTPSADPAVTPSVVRNMGPWTGSRDGEVERLRLPYRAILGEQAFVVIYAHVSKLELETPTGMRGMIAENAQSPQCRGAGRVAMYHGLRDKECPRCSGRGWIRSKP
jgi:hypothetical protein